MDFGETFAPTSNLTSDSLFPIESAAAADLNSFAYSQILISLSKLNFLSDFSNFSWEFHAKTITSSSAQHWFEKTNNESVLEKVTSSKCTVVCTRKPDIIYQTRCIEELFSNKLTEAWENIVKIYWVKQEDDWMSTPKSIWLNNVQCRLFNQEGQIRGRVRVISNHWLVLAINDNEDRVWPKPQANY